MKKQTRLVLGGDGQLTSTSHMSWSLFFTHRTNAVNGGITGLLDEDDGGGVPVDRDSDDDDDELDADCLNWVRPWKTDEEREAGAARLAS